MERQQIDTTRGQRMSLIGLFTNAGLALVKLLAGLLGNSYALIADAVESMSDIFASVIVWHGLRVAAQPPDEEHPYGHGKAEALAALVVGFMLVGAAIGIAIQAVRELLVPGPAPAPFTLVVLVAVIAVKEGLFRLGRRTALDIESNAVLADAWHHRSDAITSAAAMIGIGIAVIGGSAYAAADEWAALFASAIILFNAYRLIRATMNELMDAEPTELIDQVRRVAWTVPDVTDVEKVFARKSGMRYWVDMHIGVDPAMSVRAAHALAHKVQDTLREEVPTIAAVLVHVEPHEPGAPSRQSDPDRWHVDIE